MSSAAGQALERCNRCCGEYLQNWYRFSGGQWTPGVIADAALRGRMDCFMPWEAIRSALAALGRTYLPEPQWLPQLLAPRMLENICDFWAELPQFSGRLTFRREELLPLFCAMADPPRYGTGCGRYPEQLASLRGCGRQFRTMVDLGCGVGLGTLELSRALGIDRTVGVTLEPLEAWMARQRLLPHDPVRQRQFAPFSAVSAQFRCGDVLDGLKGVEKCDLLICNGLAGGRFMERTEQLRRFVAVWGELLQPSGVAALANAFHAGCRSGVERLVSVAAACGWSCCGSWRNLFFSRGAFFRWE